MDFSHFLIAFVNIINEMSPYILLGFFIAGLLHVFVNEKTLLRHLSGNGFKTVVKAAAIGIPLPLCSCGVLPTAVSLRRQGASKAATTSFLIATPQTGVDSIAATYSLLGWAFALLRPVAALVCAIFGGMAVGRFDPDTDGKHDRSTKAATETPKPFHKKVSASLRYGFVDMMDSIGKWLVIGLLIATLITVIVPDSWFTGLRQYPLAAMLLVVLIAVPMYICATGSIPIALSLMLKGLSPGVAFVLLMAGPAANFASIVILSRTQGRRATAIYVASVVLTAIAFGLIIDYCLPASWFALGQINIHTVCHTDFGIFESACSIVLTLLIIWAAVRYYCNKNSSTACCGSCCGNCNNTTHTMTQEYKVIGMNCAHCRASVEKAIREVEGVEDVAVNLSTGIATVTGDAPAEKIREAIINAGFEVA